MTNEQKTEAPDYIVAGPSKTHGWLHGHCSNVLMQDEDDVEYTRTDRGRVRG